MKGMSQLKGHFSMLGANVMWGMMAPVAKMVMAGGLVAPLLMTDFRIFGAAVLFWLTSLLLPREHVPLPDILRLAGAGMLGIVFNQGCYVFGVGYTYPSEASIITTTMPIWVMILAALFLGEPITWKKVGGIVLGGSGAVLLVMGGHGSSAGMNVTNPVLGDILVLTAQLSYALYLTLYKNFIKKYSLVTLMKWMFTFASLAILPFSLPTIIATRWASITMAEAAGVAYVVLGGTFIAYIFVMIGQKALRPTLVGMYNYVQPIVATSIGIWMGLDVMTPVKGLAVAMIFSGVLLVNLSKAAHRHKPTPVDGDVDGQR